MRYARSHLTQPLSISLSAASISLSFSPSLSSPSQPLVVSYTISASLHHSLSSISLPPSPSQYTHAPLRPGLLPIMLLQMKRLSSLLQLPLATSSSCPSVMSSLRHHLSTITCVDSKPRIAIVGSGPGGFYAAQRILKVCIRVCVCVYVYVYVCQSVYVCVCVYIVVDSGMCVCVFVCMCECVYECVRVCVIDIKKVDKQLNVVYGIIRCSRSLLPGPLLFI